MSEDLRALIENALDDSWRDAPEEFHDDELNGHLKACEKLASACEKLMEENRVMREALVQLGDADNPELSMECLQIANNALEGIEGEK